MPTEELSTDEMPKINQKIDIDDFHKNNIGLKQQVL